MRITRYTVTCLVFLFGGIYCEINTKQEYYKVDDIEEYFVEHAVSTQQARNIVRHLDADSVQTKPGCQKCTSQEIRYCLGSHLINDHCCCDKRYAEFFPYIPHTCYIGEKLCKPLAKDCAEYSRIRICCCDKLVLEKWKHILSKGPKIYFYTKLFYLTMLIYLFI